MSSMVKGWYYICRMTKILSLLAKIEKDSTIFLSRSQTRLGLKWILCRTKTDDDVILALSAYRSFHILIISDSVFKIFLLRSEIEMLKLRNRYITIYFQYAMRLVTTNLLYRHICNINIETFMLQMLWDLIAAYICIIL